MRAKKDNGDRILGLVTMVARLWPMTREEHVQQWNRYYFAHWDAIAKGNSAIREACERCLHEELSTYLRIPQAHGLLDIAQFYDTIHWVTLIDDALDLNFPPE
eukprot:6739979-Pyramimonas_sp.AAC.1